MTTNPLNSIKKSEDSSFTPVSSPSVVKATPTPTTSTIPSVESIQKPMIQLDQVNSSNLELTPMNINTNSANMSSMSNISNISNGNGQMSIKTDMTPVTLEPPSPLPLSPHSPITPLAETETFDPNWSIFEGLEIKQKFNNKSNYDSRYIWVSLNTRTIHMSQYMTKERRHKEASLNDVTEVSIGYPEKMKPNTKASEVGDIIDAVKENCCLTITFKRGGGIDLLFNTVTDRDSWHTAINRMIIEFTK